MSGSGDLAGSTSAELPSGASGFSSTDASGSALSGEGSGINIVFSGTDSIMSGEGSVSGGIQEAGEGSTEILIFPSSEAGSGVLSGSGDLSGSGTGSGFSSVESGSSTDSSEENRQFSGMSSGFITSQDFSGSSGFPSGFSSGSASGQSGELSGSGDAQILLIDGELIDVSTSISHKEYELGGGLLAFSGSGDISGSGSLSGDLSGSASGSGSGFFSGVTFVGSGFTDLTVSSSGEQEASGFLLYSSGQGSGGLLSGFGSSSFLSGSGSGMSESGRSGSESSTSGEEGSVTFLTGDFMTEVSGDTTLSMELGQGPVEYSGEGSSSGSGFYSGSGETHLFTASGISSGASSRDLPQVVLLSPSSEGALTESTTGPEEALSGAELSQTLGDIYGTPGSVLAPAGLVAPPITATPASVQTPGTVESKSTYFFM